MWLYIKQLLQLLLSPARGWEDISETSVAPEILIRKGFYPLVVVTALSELFPLLYTLDLSVVAAIMHGIAVGCALIAGLYLSRMVLDMFLWRFVSGKVNTFKVSLFNTYLMGLNCFYVILNNIVPASLTILKIIPLLSVVIIIKAMPYLSISEDSKLSYISATAACVILIPVLIASILFIFI